MLAKVHTAAVVGLVGAIVQVEVDTARGLPSFTIVGLPDAAVQESRERVQAAVKNSGLDFPRQRVTVNLAPADLRKEGPAYDLPIALGTLAASEQIQAEWLQGALAVGELSLDGSLRHVRGMLPMAALARARQSLRSHDVPLRRVIVHHDQDPVFTGYGWTARLLLKDHVRVPYALNGARDNPEMEGFNSRFKIENRSLFLDTRTLDELEAVVAERKVYYNRDRRHSSIGYRAPASYIANLQPWP